MGDRFYGEQALGRKEVSDAAEMYNQAALERTTGTCDSKRTEV